MFSLIRVASLYQEDTVMSRIALIYPKLAIFRSRKQMATVTSPINCDWMKNPTNLHLDVVLLSIDSHQLTSLRKYSAHSAPSIGMQTTSTLIQKDLFELASKALLELEQSKNSSSLIVEVSLNYFYYIKILLLCFSCY